ncbi:hypothetical protein NDU88_003708 [Pleurodeles waltl]|uniref:Uncharacterized protein n=1 Tax=Pleurodeles waltl TaxID=8319 RepID=A0AAV7KW63_PLEWA|nr:hypothetical protein NDU88_003708 [Pleurodeles waltl]
MAATKIIISQDLACSGDYTREGRVKLDKAGTLWRCLPLLSSVADMRPEASKIVLMTGHNGSQLGFAPIHHI